MVIRAVVRKGIEGTLLKNLYAHKREQYTYYYQPPPPQIWNPNDGSAYHGCLDVVKVEMRNVLPADKSSLKNNEFDIIRCNTLVFSNIGITVQSRFSDNKFSDNLCFSDYFTKTIFSIYNIKFFDFVTLFNLVTVFEETKSITKLILHCIAICRMQFSIQILLKYVSIFAKPIRPLKKLMLLILLVISKIVNVNFKYNAEPSKLLQPWILLMN